MSKVTKGKGMTEREYRVARADEPDDWRAAVGDYNQRLGGKTVLDARIDAIEQWSHSVLKERGLTKESPEPGDDSTGDYALRFLTLIDFIRKVPRGQDRDNFLFELGRLCGQAELKFPQGRAWEVGVEKQRRAVALIATRNQQRKDAAQARPEQVAAEYKRLCDLHPHASAQSIYDQIGQKLGLEARALQTHLAEARRKKLINKRHVPRPKR